MGADSARTTRLLDHAEYLVTLLIRGKDDEFRQYLETARGEFPECQPLSESIKISPENQTFRPEPFATVR